MISKQDYDRFYVAKPDPGFSPDRNNAIVEGTIKKYEATVRRKQKEYANKVGERADAVATYLKSFSVGTPVEKYFGKRTLAYLRGQKILQKIKFIHGKRYVELVEL